MEIDGSSDQSSPASSGPAAAAMTVSRSIGTPYRRFSTTDRYDVVVIGSGIGGLAAAGLLAKIANLRVLVLERHYTAGGFTHVFHRPGFEWDVGVHYIGQVHHRSQPAALLDYLTEGRLAWHAMPDAYDRVIVDGLRFDYVTGERRLRERLVAAFPREGSAIDRYFTLVNRVVRRVAPFFIDKALPPALARVAGPVLRAPFLRLARFTTADVLGDLRVSPELRAVLTAQWPDYGLPPSQSSFAVHAIIAQHYFDGGAYPVGGASRIAASVLPVIERAGGAVVINASVERILVDRQRAVGVRMTDGREFRAGAVISDAGVRSTLELLPADASPATGHFIERLRTIPPSSAHLCLYVGLTSSGSADRADPSNLLIHRSLDFDTDWTTFADDLDAPFPVVYISFPSAKDPTFERRYPGHDTIEIIVPASHALFAKWDATDWKHRGADYETLKRRLTDRMLDVLYRHRPSADGRVVMSELSTPLSTRHFVAAPNGEIYGLAHVPARFMLRELRPTTPVRNLFLTGQDIATCGVVGALFGGALTVSAMLRKNVLPIVSTPAAHRASAARS